jgi:beta-aspartyl-peptidase (threonine type)
MLARTLFALSPVLLALGCSSAPERSSGARWALALHGGAGTIARDASEAEKAEHKASLEAALEVGRGMLARGDSALDACEAVVRMLEDDPRFNAGKGAVFNEQGEHELDASIMDGATLRCGAVAGVRTVKNPVSLARLVMQETKHVLLMGDGAEQFATLMKVERVPNEWFDTEKRRKVLEEVLRERREAIVGRPGADPRRGYGTVGCVALDSQGRLAAATSTGGLTGKRWGRVGDTPIIGAGNWADLHVAISGTGTGEQFIRHAVARTIAARMQFGGESLREAADAVVLRTLDKDDGGVVAVDKQGNIATPYSSDGMYRGIAHSDGRFEVRIHED